MLIKTNDPKIDQFLAENTSYIERFCNPEELTISSDIVAPDLAMSAVLTGAEIFLPLAGLINIEEEISRLEKELAKWTSEVKRVQGKLGNERFVSNAPEEVVEAERAKEKDYLEKQAAVKERIHFWQRLAKKVEVTLMEFAASLTISSRFYNRWLIISKSTTEFI